VETDAALRFRRNVLAATAVGFAIRVAYVLLVARNDPLGGDPSYYHGLSQMLADGHGWIEPYLYGFGLGAHQTASHPPLFPLLLAVASKIGLGTVDGQRLVACTVGSAVIPLVALAARRYGGMRAGVIAAAIAACYPYLWLNDVGLWSESLLAVFVALVLLTADAAGQEPSVRRAAWLGVAVGLAALTRAEQLLLVPLLVWPLLLRRGTAAGRDRLVQAGAATLATALVITPWAGWNLTRFDHPVFMSTDLGGTVFNTNCDLVWRGAETGWWTFLPPCPGDIGPREAPDESTRDLRLRARGLHYVRTHLRRAPVVVAARVGRVWGVYRPLQTRDLDERGSGAGWPKSVGLIGFYALLLLSIPGIVLVRRKRHSVLPFVAFAAVVTITAASFYGHPRFRTPVEVGAIVLAAVALDRLVERRRSDAGALTEPAGKTPGPSLHAGPLRGSA